MRRLPPLAAIRVFEAAARLENFTSAASELGMTQAAVSYQVKLLEERLGAALFVREKGRARLTPLGGRLLPPLTGAFQVEHPDLAVRLATANKLVDLKAGEADVAIRAGARPTDGLDNFELMKV